MTSGDITVVILAAGESVRLGRPKQLVPVEGIPLVARAARTALAANLGPVVVVLGAHAALVAPALDGLHVHVVMHTDWRHGMGSSIAAGVNAALARPGCNAVVLMTCDQPGVTPEHLCRLAALWREADTDRVASAYGGTRGTPALFSRSQQTALTSLVPPDGARALLRDAPAVPCPACETDIDFPADLQAL